jgi:hypothetical protein
MTTKTFQTLAQDICRFANTSADGASQSYLKLDVDGITFTLLENAANEGTIVYFCDFGLAPHGDDRAEILQRLLEANLAMYGTGSPSFSLDFDTGHVLLMGQASLDVVNAEKLLSAFTKYAAQAKHWRDTHFLTQVKSSPTRKTYQHLLSGTDR